MDFQSAMETFAEAWVAANTQTPLTEAQALALSRSNESGSTSQHSHEDSVQKDNNNTEVEGNSGQGSGGGGGGGGGGGSGGHRTVTTLVPRCSSAPEPFHPKPILVRPVCNTAKSIPVHCIVEQVPSPQRCGSPGDFLQTTVELDSYAIIPSGAPFCELVRMALMKLGYSSSDIIGAKGAIQIKNWKPLAFETITEDSTATVAEILGELTTVATLRIRLYSRPKISSANDVKEKLLQLLLTQSQSLLISAGCPIDETLLTLISKGGNQCKIPEDIRRRFDKWYIQQVLHHRQLSSSIHLPLLDVTSSCTGNNTHSTSSGILSSIANNDVTSNGACGSGSNCGGNSSTSVAAAAAIAAAAAHRTRMRTSFDPEMELPKLHRWFSENQHPTRLQIQQYVRELNTLESRKGRKPLDVNNVVYWFKNARAAYKRAELRQSNGSHSPGHDSTSNDNNLLCRTIEDVSQQEEEIVNDVLEDRRFRLASSSEVLLAITSSETGSGGGGKGRCTASSNAATSSEAMDLSMTHRESGSSDSLSVINGHWKTVVRSTSPSSSSSKKTREDSTNSIKQEPVDRTPSSVSTDDNEDEDDDDYDGPLAASDTVEVSSLDRKSLRASPPSSLLPYAAQFSPHSRSQQQQQHHHHHSHSMLYMAGFVPSSVAAALDERRKRNRTFIDPVTEVPRLEQWFGFNTHPPHSLILKYTDELNQMPYRQKFPKLEPKNVQFWFKNRRAKCKRLRLSVNLVTSQSSASTATTAATAASW